MKKKGEFDVNKVIKAQKNVNSYAFEGDIGIGMGQEYTFGSMNGKIDIENKKRYIYAKFSPRTDTEIYLIGYEAHIKNENGWTKMPISDYFDRKNRFEIIGIESYENDQIIEILKSPYTKVDVVGEKIVDRVACYKVKIVPEDEKLKEIFFMVQK